MKLTSRANFKWENYKKAAPINWEIWIRGLTGFFAALIPVCPEIRSLPDNVKHDLSLVVFPIIIGLLTFFGLFVGKTSESKQ